MLRPVADVTDKSSPARPSDGERRSLFTLGQENSGCLGCGSGDVTLARQTGRRIPGTETHHSLSLCC